MFETNQLIYYIDQEFKIKQGVFKGYIKLCLSTQIIHIVDNELQESLLINEDFVFHTYDEARENLYE